MREEGWWPKLLHWVSIITATKAVGPTQGLTVYINTKYSDFMGDVMVIISSPVPAGLVANYISLATALGSSFTDQEYKARESIWLGREKRAARGGSFGDTPPAIRNLDPVQLPPWTMPLDLHAWPKPAEAFVIGHLYEGIMLIFFRDITCLTDHAVVHFRSGIPHSSRTSGQATISCRRTPTSGCLEWSLSVNPNSHPVENQQCRHRQLPLRTCHTQP